MNPPQRNAKGIKSRDQASEEMKKKGRASERLPVCLLINSMVSIHDAKKPKANDTKMEFNVILKVACFINLFDIVPRTILYHITREQYRVEMMAKALL